MYPGWLTTANLCRHVLYAMAEVDASPRATEEPPFSEGECYARWPQLEDAVRYQAANLDADPNVREALQESMINAGKFIAAMCDPKTRAEMAFAVAEEMRRRDLEEKGEC